MRIIMVIFMFGLFGLSTAGELLKPGDKAPDFELKDSNGKIHRLSDYKGKTVVLYFYPKDDTPGCTAQACNLRDNFDVLKDKGLVVLGVSQDDPKSHDAFTKKYNLPFTLLADTSKKVIKAYGADGGITRIFMPKRITYLIDNKGLILHRFDNVNASNHTKQILDVLEIKK
ncbi:MAG: thioredoxin-dependent thiol peroxidase [Calditrichaceae bacterium]|nr:thioredoxin-dependent thiol peroxidase [Calditrichaceae bacterium]MBN2710164.1 thioredoxin-dependent thiol peroxidase [Calditrichaceae bacterium]RQV94177.1 MAG: thioredoxin-dependent thiol peroxidase [Calditrichota bacterium]